MAKVELPANYQQSVNTLNGVPTQPEQPAQVPAAPKEKLISTTVTIQEPSRFRKMLRSLVPANPQEFRKSIWRNFVKPYGRDMLMGIIQAILYHGDSAPVNRSGMVIGGPLGYLNYNKISQQHIPPQNAFNTPVTTAFNYIDFRFEDWGSAEYIRKKLIEDTMDGKIASVSDYYAYVGLTAPYPANDYGWVNLSDANTRVVNAPGGGFTIVLPREMPIDHH